MRTNEKYKMTNSNTPIQTNDEDNELPLEEKVTLFTQSYKDYKDVFGSDSSAPKLKPVGLVCSSSWNLDNVNLELRKKALKLGATYVFGVKYEIATAQKYNGNVAIEMIVSGDAYKREI